MNDAPTCADRTLATDEDTPAAVSPSCSDVEGVSLTYEIAAQGTKGTASVVDGKLRYEPAANENGADTFTYRASDGTATSAPANAEVTVAPVNDPPTCSERTLATDEDTQGSTPPDCADVDGDALTYEIAAQGAKGTASVVDGKLRYQPNANESGQDSFTYRASDGKGGASGAANVAVTIAAVNDKPSATDETVSMTEGETKTITLAGADVEGSALSFRITVLPLDGTLYAGGDTSGTPITTAPHDLGSGDQVTYEPNVPDFFGVDQFEFTARDAELESGPAPVTVVVENVNDAPTCADRTLATEEDTPGTVSPSCSDADGDALTYEIAAQGMRGTASVVGGELSYQPNADVNGTDAFTYRASDGAAASSAASVGVTIAPVDDAPQARDDTLTTEENTGGTVDVLANDSDPDGDALTVTGETDGAHGAVDCTPAGSCTYTPEANFNGADSFTYTVADGKGGTATGTVAVTVAAANDAPTCADGTLATEEDTPAASAPSCSDPEGDSLTYEIATQGTKGTASVVDGKLRYEPAANENGADTFTYRASDGTLTSEAAKVDVTVAPVNDPPVAGEDADRAAEGGVVVLDLTANDSPGPRDEGQPLAVEAVVAPPSYGAATVVATGANAGKVQYAAPAAYQGPDWLEYKVCDSEGACSRGSVRLQVARVAATAETEPVPNAGDAADDAAIWVHPGDPSLSTVIGTDKGGVGGTGGLGVYDLSGRQLQYLEVGKMNNVDLRGGFPLANAWATLVAASDRGKTAIALYTVDVETRTLAPVPGGPIDLDFEPYGLCMYRSGERFYVFVTDRDRPGHVEQLELAATSGGAVTGTRVRSLEVGSLTEGCVADDELGRLYLAEEQVGIWRYSAEPDGGTERVLVDSVGPAGPLVGDVEGLSLAYLSGGRGYVVAASQGNGSYTVYRREGDNAFARSFRIKDGDGVDGTSGIDGVDVTTAALGPSFPNGLFVSQDGTNVGAGGLAENQNFKLAPLELALGGGTVAVPPRPTTCPRPYSDTSPWNTPTGDTPDAPFVDPAVFDKRLSSDPTQYTYPVYEVTSETPLQAVTLDPNGWFSNVTSETEITSLQGLVVQLPIPPDAEAAAGGDAQIILVNRETGDEWGAFRLQRNATTGTWEASNAYHYNTSWSGVPPYGATSNDRFWSRGAGVPYFAGLVRPCEIARGRIEHALAFAYDFPTPEFVYPATKSDGKSTEPHDLPEGTRLQLDPSATVDEIQSWGCTGPCLTLARALQEYGMYVIDASARPKVMFEYEATAGWNGVVDEETAAPIPLSRLKVLPPPQR